MGSGKSKSEKPEKNKKFSLKSKDENKMCCNRETCKRRNPQTEKDNNQPCCADQPACSRRAKAIIIYLDDDDIIERGKR